MGVEGESGIESGENSFTVLSPKGILPSYVVPLFKA